jgi:hypothetical protein
MIATVSDPIAESRWLTYTKAIAFISPAVVAWGFACIFLVPKVREISATAGVDPSEFGWLWPATFFLVQWGRSILVAGIVTLVLLECVAPGWRVRRRLTVGIGIWLVNVMVLSGLTVLLVIVLVAAPGLAHPQ